MGDGVIAELFVEFGFEEMEGAFEVFAGCAVAAVSIERVVIAVASISSSEVSFIGRVVASVVVSDKESIPSIGIEVSIWLSVSNAVDAGVP
jgi:hypothetical protein